MFDISFVFMFVGHPFAHRIGTTKEADAPAVSRRLPPSSLSIFDAVNASADIAPCAPMSWQMPCLRPLFSDTALGAPLLMPSVNPSSLVLSPLVLCLSSSPKVLLGGAAAREGM